MARGIERHSLSPSIGGGDACNVCPCRSFPPWPSSPKRQQRKPNSDEAQGNDADSDDNPSKDGLKNFSSTIQEKSTNALQPVLLL
eukprot:scaffold187228_cov30-Prasinocladus_malaysianus.AAC.1